MEVRKKQSGVLVKEFNGTVRWKNLSEKSDQKDLSEQSDQKDLKKRYTD